MEEDERLKQLNVQEHTLPGKTQHEGQTLANAWIYENTHVLGEGTAQEGSAPGKERATREHALPMHLVAREKKNTLPRRTSHKKDQHLENTWIHGKPHFLEEGTPRGGSAHGE